MLPGAHLLPVPAQRGFPGSVVLLRLSSLGIRGLLQSRIFSKTRWLSLGPSNKFSPLGLFARGAVTGLQSWGACNTPGGCGERGRLRAGGVVLAAVTQDPRSAPAALLGHSRDTTAPCPATAMGKEVFSPSAPYVCLVCARRVHRAPQPGWAQTLSGSMSRKTASPSAFRSGNAVLSR